MIRDVSPLFRPLEVKSKTLRNRIIMPPMVMLRTITSPEGIEWYRERAAGGVSLAIVEATAVNRFGRELTAKNLKPLVKAIHDGGALAAIQLFPVSFDFPRNDHDPLPAPDEIDVAEIDHIIDEYRTAVDICAEAGFDGVEPHGAHNYPINQFFSPVQNKRKDDYGGSIENRMRFALDIVSAVDEGCGDDMILLYRHTPVGKGYGIEESQVFAGKLVEAGVDILDISPSSTKEPGDRALPFMGFGVPVIAVNELDEVDRALEVLNEDRADLVAVGRGLIADPLWPTKVKEGRPTSIVRCERCGKGCFGHLKLGIPVECLEWAA